jgi:hypothetical protein
VLDELEVELVQLQDEKLLHDGELCQSSEIIGPVSEAYCDRNMELLSFKLPLALRRRLAAEARRRLAAECAKLDPKFEKAMAEEGLSRTRGGPGHEGRKAW